MSTMSVSVAVPGTSSFETPVESSVPSALKKIVLEVAGTLCIKDYTNEMFDKNL